MEPERRRSAHSKGGRRQSIFRSMDDYERHMQSSVDADDGPYYDDSPREPYVGSARLDEVESTDRE